MINLLLEGRFPQKDRLSNFGSDVINHFFKRDRKENIIISVEMKRKLDENNSGYCVDFGTQYHQFGTRSGKWRSILISLSRNYDDGDTKFPYCVRDIASTLAHELVHAKQYIRRELTNKALVAGLAKVSEGQCDYNDLPWEEEAYDLEQELLELYW
jgi:hypothetical protein